MKLLLRTTKRAMATMMLVLGALTAAAASSVPHAWANTNLSQELADVPGPVEVHLAYSDQNGNPQDVDLAATPSSLFNVLPDDLKSLSTSLSESSRQHMTLSSTFGNLWTAYQSQICASISRQIMNDIHTSDNSAYDVGSCLFEPFATLTARQLSHWPNPLDISGPDLTGQAIFMHYHIPDNTVVFTVTSPFTCHESKLACAADPKFTLVFDVDLGIIVENPGSPSLTCPFQAYVGTSFDIDTVLSGDDGDAIAGAVQDALASLTSSAASAAASGAASILSGAGAAAIAAKLAAKLAALGVAAIGNSSLRDTVSSDLSLITAPSLPDAAAQAAVQGFHDISQGCQAARKIGFTQVDASATSDGSLRFTLTRPLDDQLGGLTDTSSPAGPASSGSPSITGNFGHPQISALPGQVGLGGHLTVNGSFFPYFDPVHIHLVWNPYEMVDVSESDINWGPVGGPLTTTVKPRTPGDGQNFLDATNLSPNTTYQFRVRDCDPITCSQWSDWLQAKTAAGGSNAVTLYLDGFTPADQMGTATVGSDGTFRASAAIPSATVPGQHTLYAVQAIGGQASTPVMKVGNVHLPSGMLQGALSTSSTGLRNAPVAAKPSGALTTGLQSGSTIIRWSGAGTVAPSGLQAQTTIIVNGTTQAAQRTIELLDPTTNTILSSVMEGNTFIVQGAGFAQGSVNVTLDSASGQQLGTATVAADGTFSGQFIMPRGTGNQTHTVLAIQQVNGTTTQATASVFVEQIPR